MQGFKGFLLNPNKTPPRDEIVSVPIPLKTDTREISQYDPPANAKDIYVPLNTDKREIRVLQLFPDSIATKLSILDLDQPRQPYYAISYAWGSRALNRAININNVDFGIPTKQSDILHTIKNLLAQSTPVHIWLDFICIDQGNIQEKNRQVSLMGDIFQNADAVYAYVGNDGHPKLHPQAMLTSSYWLRRWIVQELALAREVHLVSANGCNNWEGFCSSLDTQGMAKKSLRQYSQHWSTFESIRKIRSRDHGTKSNLRQLLHDFRHTESTEPYDRIYALLSLAHLNDRSRIQVDYRKSLFGVFFEVASIMDNLQDLVYDNVLDVLYSELASKRPRQILAGYRAFASRSRLLSLGPIQYYGVVEDAEFKDIDYLPSIPSMKVWSLDVAIRASIEEQHKIEYTIPPSPKSGTLLSHLARQIKFNAGIYASKFHHFRNVSSLPG